MTSITIDIEGAKSTLEIKSSQRVRLAFEAFYARRELGPPDAETPQKLEAVLRWFVGHVSRVAQEHHTESVRISAIQEAKDRYDFSGDITKDITKREGEDGTEPGVVEGDTRRRTEAGADGPTAD